MTIEPESLDPDDLRWMDRAACVGNIPHDAFFPSNKKTQTAALKLIKPYCDSCPVYQQCYEHAVAHEEYGIWACTTGRQRERIRGTRRANKPRIATGA